MASIDAFGGRGQSEPIRREAVLGGKRIDVAGQMMALVEHHQAEARAEVLHVEEGGVVRRDGDRLDEIVAAADDADLTPKPVAEKPVPLRDEIEGRGDDERLATHGVDGQQRHLGLSGAGGQDDEAATLRGAPRLQRLGLEGTRFPAHPQAAVERAILPRLVLIRDPVLNERADHRRIRRRGRAEPPGASVPPAGIRQRRVRILDEPADIQRAGDEAKADGHGPD